MAAKRKDHRGRVLPPNVSQKPDRRYIWRKTINGHQYILTDNDLNALKKKIVVRESEIQNGLYTSPSRITLNEWFHKWMDVYKGNLKVTTRENYLTGWRNYVQESRVGKMQISKIKRMHLVELYKELSEDRGLATSTIHTVHITIYGCLADAADDGLIQENPAVNAFKKIRHKEPQRRQALSVREQEIFTDFVSGNDIFKVHLPMFAFFLGTGARFGEMAGLTWSDIDLQRNIISINHTMHYSKVDGRMKYHVSTPKTKNGIREIPVLPELKKLLLRKKQYDFMLGIHGNAEVDGYTDFVFHTAQGKPYTETGVNAIITRIVNAYNRMESDRAEEEKRDPELLPDFSPHVLRHTFCTRFCENESNIKVIQSVMGHGDIKTTMNIYAHATEDKVQETMQELSTKIKIC